MRRTFFGLVILAFAATAFAQRVEDLNTGRHAQLFPDKEHAAKLHAARVGSNLIDHGGAVIPNAHVISIFWGPSWGSGGTDNATASALVNFFKQFGTTPEYNVITQYRVNLATLGSTTWNDSSTPPTNVTDADVQAEVIKYIQNVAHGAADGSTIYEVFLPSTSYASFGNSDSCGGPNLVFCAYHSNFSFGGLDVKYSSMPYPSCSGCQWSGWTVAQNLDHFACHETREAVTDADGTAWYDRRGNEADDKCAWSPAPFLDGGFGYQWEWSNLAGGCVQTR